VRYVIIALLAFILGILITVFCFHIRELNKKDEKDQ